MFSIHTIYSSIEIGNIFGKGKKLSADLSVTKTGSPHRVFLGDLLTYTVVVTNNGPSYSGFITCTLGTLVSCNAAFVEISIALTLAVTITNTSTVTGNDIVKSILDRFVISSKMRKNRCDNLPTLISIHNSSENPNVVGWCQAI